jgi:hypothetical protein
LQRCRAYHQNVDWNDESWILCQKKKTWVCINVQISNYEQRISNDDNICFVFVKMRYNTHNFSGDRHWLHR